MILGFFLFSLITACASALHGQNKVPKWVAILFHVVGGLAASLAAPLAAGLYWGFLRSGKQARAELDYLGKDVKKLKTGGTLAKIEDAYPPIIGPMIAKVMEYVQTHPWPYLADKPSRVQQEFSGGLALGAILFPVAYLLEVLVRVVF